MYVGECATGASFDPNLQNCLPEEFVDCSHITTTPKSPTTESECTTPAPTRRHNI